MPILSAFFGIVVRLFNGDHNPPHIHVFYADHEAIIDIKTRKIIAGSLPIRAKNLVLEWHSMHQKKIEKAWEDASSYKKPSKIPPLE